LKGGQWFGYLPLARELKRGGAPSPSKERGTKGVRLINNPLPLSKGKRGFASL